MYICVEFYMGLSVNVGHSNNDDGDISADDNSGDNLL